jgi:hypothetical protein
LAAGLAGVTLAAGFATDFVWDLSLAASSSSLESDSATCLLLLVRAALVADSSSLWARLWLPRVGGKATMGSNRPWHVDV